MTAVFDCLAWAMTTGGVFFCCAMTGPANKLNKKTRLNAKLLIIFTKATSGLSVFYRLINSPCFRTKYCTSPYGLVISAYHYGAVGCRPLLDKVTVEHFKAKRELWIITYGLIIWSGY